MDPRNLETFHYPLYSHLGSDQTASRTNGNRPGVHGPAGPRGDPKNYVKLNVLSFTHKKVAKGTH